MLCHMLRHGVYIEDAIFFAVIASFTLSPHTLRRLRLLRRRLLVLLLRADYAADATPLTRCQ